MLFGSVTELKREAHIGVHAVVGSHGGVATGRHALSVEVASLVVHDAGFGLDDAGIAALKILESQSIPAAAVSHDSARIGDAEDVLARGIVSACNAQSRGAGVVPGMTVAEAHTRMVSAGSGAGRGASVAEVAGRGASVAEVSFHMEELPKVRECRIWLLDSASMITAEMAGGIAITGSHGGLPGGSASRAVKADVRFCVFNDAGIGLDGAGISRLSPLDTRNIPAACVEAASARIGEAASTYATGRISRVNNSAHSHGVRPGQSVQAAIEALLAACSGAPSN